jgi:4-amino-4-deoxy-L-arabinose transferase-like glycosyltransferase
MTARTYWLLLAALAAVWFGTLDYRKLIKPDEGRYAEISREMALSGDWVTPRLNGIKYFEKPPLQYWTTAAAFKLFGEDEWTARLWTALTGFLGILLTCIAGRALFGPSAGLLAAGILASSLLYVFMGHINALDMGLSFFLALAITAFALAQREGTPADSRRQGMLVVWAALALAVLSKGIVALVLTGGTLVLYSLLTRDFAVWRRLELLRGLPLFLVVAAPWFVAVSLANPEFPHFFFIHEHVERFLTTQHNRVQPGWYFGPILLLGLLPWSLLALHRLPGAWAADRRGRFRPRVLLIAWCVVVFGFFSVSGSKLPSYIVPMFPALALLLGDRLRDISPRALAGHAALIAVLAVVALAAVSHAAGRDDPETPRAMAQAYAIWLQAAAGAMLLAALAAAALAVRRRTFAALLSIAAGGAVAATLALTGHEELAPSNSAWHIVQKIKDRIPPEAPIYAIKSYDQTLPFYLKRTITLVAFQDEFAFGLRQQPDLWVPDIPAFVKLWQEQPLAFAFIDQNSHDDLVRAKIPFEIVAQDTRRYIVRNRKEP